MADPNVVNTAYAVAVARKASQKVLLSLFEAGTVESNFTNHLSPSNLDSVGYLQQRPSQGWANPTNVATATNSYLDRAIAYEKAHPNATAGEIAQSVQRSAYPGKYDASQAQALATLGTVDKADSDSLLDTLKNGVTGALGGGLDAITPDWLQQIAEAVTKFVTEFVTEAKLLEKIATSITKLFLPSNLLRVAAGVLAFIFLCVSLYFLGRELRT